MGNCIAVIAYSGDRATIADFWPRWKSLGLPIVGFVPDGEDWPGHEQPAMVHRFGRSAHGGPDAFARVWNALDRLAQSDYDLICVIEPDCVPVRPEMPDVFSGKLGGWSVNLTESGMFDWALLPPWTAQRATLERVAGAAKSMCGYHEDCLNVTDRWIAKVCKLNGIPFDTCSNIIGYVNHPMIGHMLRALSPAWVHGFKSMKALEEAWNTTRK